MPFYASDQNKLITPGSFNPIDTFLQAGSNGKAPWDSIIDFATHPSFCKDIQLYPRQQTLLKLIFLETENMTAYDLEVINEWREGFKRHRDVYGVQPDIWERVKYLKERGYRRFPHIQLVLGRRASKGFTSAVVMAEQIAYLYSLDDPQTHFGITSGKDVFGAVGATSQTVAQRQQFADIRGMMQKCSYLIDRGAIAETKDHALRIRTPADLRLIAEMKAKKVPIDHQIASLWAVALSASSVAGRGSTSFFNCFDEFAFHVQGTGSTKSGDEIYEDWQPALGQFGKEALTLVPSSPFTRVGKFHELYQNGKILMSSYKDEDGMSDEARDELRRTASDESSVTEMNAEPTWLIFQGPSWSLYENWERGPELVRVRFPKGLEPDLTDEVQMRRKIRNPEKFKVEREGQFAEVMGQYLDSDKVEAMFRPVEWTGTLGPKTEGSYLHRYRIHCDPASTQANFSLAIGHLEDAPPDQYGNVWPHCIFDFLHVWQAKDFPADPETGKHYIDYTKVRADISDILRRFGSTAKITFDQWNSLGMIADLRKEFSPKIRVAEVNFNQKSNDERAEQFKSLLNLGWIHSYRDTFADNGDSLLELEMKFLSEKNGKVFKQEFGPIQTKDLWDSVCVVSTELLSGALERYDSATMNHTAVGSTNGADLRSGAAYDRQDGVNALAAAQRGPNTVDRNDARRAIDAQRMSRGRRDRQYTPSRQGSIHRRGLG